MSQTVDVGTPPAPARDERVARKSPLARLMTRPEIGALAGAIVIYLIFFIVAPPFRARHPAGPRPGRAGREKVTACPADDSPRDRGAGRRDRHLPHLLHRRAPLPSSAPRRPPPGTSGSRESHRLPG